MLTLAQLKHAVHRKHLIKTDAALLCAAATRAQGASSVQVKKLAIEASVKGAKNIHFTAHLHSVEDKAFKMPDGRELT